MPISQTAFLAEILSGGSLPLSGEPIQAGQLAYFRERLKGRVFSFLVKGFLDQQKENPSITQALVARRLKRRPEQINRWLSGPSNMTLDTISDLVLAIYGGEPSIGLSFLGSQAPRDTTTIDTNQKGSGFGHCRGEQDISSLEPWHLNAQPIEGALGPASFHFVSEDDAASQRYRADALRRQKELEHSKVKDALKEAQRIARLEQELVMAKTPSFEGRQGELSPSALYISADNTALWAYQNTPTGQMGGVL